MDTPFGDSSQTVFIPSRELTGTREEKLLQLESFLAQLHAVRLALGGERPRLTRLEPGPVDGLRHGRPSWGALVKRFINAIFAL
jgi:hypothetical protein